MLQFKLSREIDAVVKDHDSHTINSLIRASNDFCFAKCMAEEIEALLCHPSCEIIEQLKFDYDLIKVMPPEGTCFKITERAFINH